MSMRTTLALVGVGAILGCGCSESPKPPPYRPVADVKQLMQTVVDPAADVIWGSVGTVESKEGTVETAPKNDAEWAVVRNAAFVVTESGNLLMMAPRAKDTSDWMRLSQALIDVGIRAIKAAEDKDKDAVFDVGGDIYTACSNCHQKYLVTIVEANK